MHIFGKKVTNLRLYEELRASSAGVANSCCCKTVYATKYGGLVPIISHLQKSTRRVRIRAYCLGRYPLRNEFFRV